MLCIKCGKNVSTDALHVTSLKCCICENHYHGTCMDIENPTLLSFLHVVADIGGWACVSCRKRGGKAPARATKKQENISDDIAQIKSQLVSISDALKHATINTSEGGQSVWKLPSSDIFKPPSSSHSISSPPTLDTNVRTALLSAVHTEFQSITNRALNVVVTGIKPSTIAIDAVQFSELCATELLIYPTVKSTRRLGKVVVGKIQPLLVTLHNTDDVREILNSARLLRNSASDHVRNHIYINKHMTKAESLTAYNIRKQRRDKPGNKNSTDEAVRPKQSAPNGPSSSILANTTNQQDASFIMSHMVNFPPLSSTSSVRPVLGSNQPPSTYTYQNSIPLDSNQVYIPSSSYVAVSALPPHVRRLIQSQSW